jgi:hypothetical protein
MCSGCARKRLIVEKVMVAFHIRLRGSSRLMVVVDPTHSAFFQQLTSLSIPNRKVLRA